MNSPAVSSQGMLCPHCRVPLAISERQGVEIDYCPQCRGVWLDRGELDKIIERSESSQVDTPDPRRGSWGHGEGSRDHGHGYGKHRRKRSFLSDLFD